MAGTRVAAASGCGWGNLLLPPAAAGWESCWLLVQLAGALCSGHQLLDTVPSCAAAAGAPIQVGEPGWQGPPLLQPHRWKHKHAASVSNGVCLGL